MYGWNERPTKAAVKNYIGGEAPAVVVTVGQYEVTVPVASLDDEPAITYKTPYHTDTNPRRAFPNMEVADGEIRIPVVDLVGEVLSRLEPVDLAKALWQDEEVRREFMYLLTTRYSEGGIGDGDRRTFLREVKEAVHSKALDYLAGTMASLEYDVAKRSFFYHEVRNVNDALYRAQEELRQRFNDDTITLPRLRHEDNDPDFKIGGKHWNEARDHWREDVATRFSAPEAVEVEGGAEALRLAASINPKQEA